MILPVVVALAAWFSEALTSGLAMVFTLESAPILPSVAFMAFAVLMLETTEAAITAALVGVVFDALSGSIVGLNMLGGVLVWLAARPATVLISRPRAASIFTFTALTAAAYQVGMVALINVFSDGVHPLSVGGLVITSLLTGLFAIGAFPLLNRALVFIGIAAAEENLSEKLARRKSEVRSWPW
jgi:hypothetical protein